MSSAPAFPPPGSIRAKFANTVVRFHVAIYRLSRGKFGGTLVGAPVLLLDHVGRRSGKRRTVALLFLREGEDLVVVASRGGSDAPPAWWLNLKANPQTSVQVGRARFPVIARTASTEERAKLWPRVVDMYSDYETYQQRTEREIPLVFLSRGAST